MFPAPARRRQLLLPLLAAVLLLLVVGLMAALAQDRLPWVTTRAPDPFPTPAETREGKWEQDVTYLAAQLTRLHPDPFTQVSADAFAAQTQALIDQIPTATDAEIILGMAALTAAIGDGHTALDLDVPEVFHAFPLMLAWYADDLVVVGADAEYADALGRRVTQIGSQDPAAALAAVTRWIAHDNRQQLLQRSTRLLTTPEVLAAAGILPDAKQGHFVLENVAGQVIELDVPAVRADAGAGVTVYDALKTGLPLRAQNPDRNYWYTYLPESQTLYFHYFRCADDPTQPFAAFNQEMFAFVDQNPVARVVVDLRYNGGGDSSILQPFVDAIRDRADLNRPRGLYVLIGRQTFSSALMNAVELKTRTAAILLGEPTGGKPNHFGEVRAFGLPNSGLRVQYSTRRFTTMPGNDADALAPDLAYPITWADLLAGRDPALDAATAGVQP